MGTRRFGCEHHILIIPPEIPRQGRASFQHNSRTSCPERAGQAHVETSGLDRWKGKGVSQRMVGTSRPLHS